MLHEHTKLYTLILELASNGSKDQITPETIKSMTEAYCTDYTRNAIVAAAAAVAVTAAAVTANNRTLANLTDESMPLRLGFPSNLPTMPQNRAQPQHFFPQTASQGADSTAFTHRPSDLNPPPASNSIIPFKSPVQIGSEAANSHCPNVNSTSLMPRRVIQSEVVKEKQPAQSGRDVSSQPNSVVSTVVSSSGGNDGNANTVSGATQPQAANDTEPHFSDRKKYQALGFLTRRGFSRATVVQFLLEGKSQPISSEMVTNERRKAFCTLISAGCHRTTAARYLAIEESVANSLVHSYVTFINQRRNKRLSIRTVKNSRRQKFRRQRRR